MIDVFFDNEMEMPCLCDCGRWFDLNDGRTSSQYRGDVVVCRDCYDKQSEQQELENQIEELQLDLDNGAEYTIGNRRVYKKELKELKAKLKEYEHI